MQGGVTALSPHHNWKGLMALGGCKVKRETYEIDQKGNEGVGFIVISESFSFCRSCSPSGGGVALPGGAVPDVV